jgi:diguanylate cyclase (GGDEF)-like protein
MMEKTRYTVAMKTDADENMGSVGRGQDDSPQDVLQGLYDKAFALSDRDARAARVLADEIYAKAGDAKSPYWQGLSRYLAGFCFYNLSEYDNAMEEFEHGDQIAQEHNLPNLAIKFRNGYGAIFSRLGRYHDAVEQFAEGLKKSREMGLKSEIGRFLVNLGEVSLLMGDTAQALSFESEAEGLIQKEMAGDSRYAIDTYYNLAEAQSKSGLMDEAEQSYRRSLETATRVGNTVSEVEARVRLSSILAGRGHEAEALAVIKEALRLSRSCGFALQEVGSLLACGRIELSLGRSAEATHHFEMAVNVADSHRMGDLLPPALESLSTAKAAMNRFDEAYRDLQKSVEAARAWSSSEAARMLAELAAGYRLEKVQREAEVERVRRQGLESANERLRIVTRIGRSLTQSLEPKDILMRMWSELSTSIDLKWLGFGIYSPDSGVIEFPGLIDSGVPQKASSVFLSDESSLAALCVREKRTLYYATSDEARSALGNKPIITFGPASVMETVLYLPLFRENDIVGVMTVQSARDHAYSDDIIEMLEAVASFTAIAVENARIMIRLNELNQTISGEKEQVEKVALASSWLADHDSLTGLSNRRFLERILDENIRLATLEDNGIAVFFVDLDDFKRVNDEYGHDAGDRVLVAVAARLVSVFRDGDYVARVGGDEFVVVAPGVKDASGMASMADKVVESFAETLTIAEGPVSVSISVGVALFPEHGHSSQELIRRADDAMYLIKRTGKGAWRLWSTF